jgi:hypothetical protein
MPRRNAVVVELAVTQIFAGVEMLEPEIELADDFASNKTRRKNFLLVEPKAVSPSSFS